MDNLVPQWTRQINAESLHSSILLNMVVIYYGITHELQLKMLTMHAKRLESIGAPPR